ncbi:hypothetical protein AQ914_04445 [Burkholderia pseudomallei]|uniref:hypothetical protein n=1 Tax=Burkholderia pseudomallei TaxID=28450 RepID=UPI0009760EF0|nr:hypothetical protein [Burkholderia pseudomallei]ONC26338.1 hypothetical protein AQ914_04445 [Burkholderia pseudomallei]
MSIMSIFRSSSLRAALAPDAREQIMAASSRIASDLASVRNTASQRGDKINARFEKAMVSAQRLESVAGSRKASRAEIYKCVKSVQSRSDKLFRSLPGWTTAGQIHGPVDRNCLSIVATLAQRT